MNLMRAIFVVVFLVLTFMLFGCSKADDNEVVVVDEKTGEEKVVSKEEVKKEEKEIKAFSKHLTDIFNSSLNLQDTFAYALDDLFTKESSPGQFATILRNKVVNKSRETVDKAEKYNFPVDYFELNKIVVNNLNNQHQLYLDAVNEASQQSEGDTMDIVGLRERLNELKQEYLDIVNMWKSGGKTEK